MLFRLPAEALVLLIPTLMFAYRFMNLRMPGWHINVVIIHQQG